MVELHFLRYAYVMMRSRLAAAHDNERGVTTLESVLWIAGLAVLAIATIAIITLKVKGATEKIPTGP